MNIYSYIPTMKFVFLNHNKISNVVQKEQLFKFPCSLPNTRLLFAVNPGMFRALCAWLQSFLQPELEEEVCPLGLSFCESLFLVRVPEGSGAQGWREPAPGQAPASSLTRDATLTRAGKTLRQRREGT